MIQVRSIFGVLVLVGAVAGCRRGAPTPSTSPATASAPPAEPAIAAPPVVTRLAGARNGSGVLLADLDGTRVAYVADEDAALVRVVDVDSGQQLSAVAPGGAPAELVMLRDGRLVASVRDANKLVVLRGGGTAKSKLVVEASIDVAAEPIGLALTPDDASLVATSGWGHTVTVLDAQTLAPKSTHDVAREPRAVAISSDGKRAFVAHAVGQTVDVIDLEAAKAKTARVSGSEETTGRAMMAGSQDRSACQGFALAMTDTGRVLAPHVLVFPGEPTVSEGYGGSEGREAEVFHVAALDEYTGSPIAEAAVLRAGLQEPPHCALPRAAAVGKAGLYVTCLGEDAVQLYDADALDPQDVPLARWSVPPGPTAIALDDGADRAVVWSQFAHTLTTIATKGKAVALASTSFEVPNEDAKLAKGRRLFHATKDARISSDGRACASCHPDGRDDTLVWSSPKGPRQTPILAGRLSGAAPFGWNGDAPDVDKHLVSTMKRLGGKGMTGEDKEALVAWVLSMKGPVQAKTTSDAIARGKEIFRSDQTQCSTCHGLDGDLPDGAQHDVKSRGSADVQAKFDTPSLRFLGGSAPYFHDGRYPDLKTLLVKSDGKMGHTKQLSPGELDDLTAYLETL